MPVLSDGRQSRLLPHQVAAMAIADSPLASTSRRSAK
jgi:hypothetical protein